MSEAGRGVSFLNQPLPTHLEDARLLCRVPTRRTPKQMVEEVKLMNLGQGLFDFLPSAEKMRSKTDLPDKIVTYKKEFVSLKQNSKEDVGGDGSEGVSKKDFVSVEPVWN